MAVCGCQIGVRNVYRIRTVLCLLLAVSLAGCAVAGDSGLSSQASAFAGSRSGAVHGHRVAGPYHLGPGDHVRIKVYNDDSVSGDYAVGSNGHISIPLVGDVEAAGLTTRQLEQTIVKRMQGKIARDPKINVEIIAYAPFYIYGEVQKAGEYPFRPGLTVADAVATAGGLTYRANEDRIYVRHAGATGEREVTLETPTRIFPGDNIHVAERMF
jgi:polysaccharide biosynthesis/export protein